MNFENITGVMGRSNLRAKDSTGGYNIVQVATDSVFFFIKKPGLESLKKWNAFSTTLKKYDTGKKFKRPDYAANTLYAAVVKPVWTYASTANIISSPCDAGQLVIAGNQGGDILALNATWKTAVVIPYKGCYFFFPCS